MSDEASGRNARRASISRREFVESIAGASLASLGSSSGAGCPDHVGRSPNVAPKANAVNQANGEVIMSDEIVKAKIRRALLSGPDCITKDATVAEMDGLGKMTVLRPGKNPWVCMPGNENIIGAADMCADPMGMQWMMDVMARKPRPTNTTPGLIYMLNGALQRSYTDPFDRTSPPIPIGPHWMILWPFDANHCGLPTTVRDAGAWIMFAGTPYAYLHVCGTPWAGNEYTPGDEAVWTMRYQKRTAG